MITEFEKGQWSVIQNVITFMKDDQTAMELCREADFGKNRSQTLVPLLERLCGKFTDKEIYNIKKKLCFEVD